MISEKEIEELSKDIGNSPVSVQCLIKGMGDYCDFLLQENSRLKKQTTVRETKLLDLFRKNPDLKVAE